MYMGNWVLYSDISREYADVILNVNSFSPTDKQLNYVIWKADYNDDEDTDTDTDEYNSDDEREIYLDKFYSRYNH
jgi:hypothetical protein